MDCTQSLTSKLKAKVKGVKGKVHLPGHKKRQGDNGDADSDYSSDESPRRPGPETGYNLGASTPFTTVKNTPLSPEHPQTHNRDYAPSSAPSSERENSGGDHTGQQPYPTSTTAEGVPGHSDARSSPSQPSPGMLEQVKQTMGSAAAAVGSQIGYYTEVESSPHEQIPANPNAPTMMEKTKAALGMNQPSDPNAPTMMEKTKAALGMNQPSDPNAPTTMEKTKAALGTNQPSDPNAPTMMEKTKAALGMNQPSDPNAPTMMEKTKAALGMNQPSDPNAPTMMEKTKAALGMNQPSDPSAPTMMEKTKATLGMGPGSPTTTESPQQQPGIVDRVSGAVSSLFTISGDDVQHTFPAHSDDVPRVGGGSAGGEKTTTSST